MDAKQTAQEIIQLWTSYYARPIADESQLSALEDLISLHISTTRADAERAALDAAAGIVMSFSRFKNSPNTTDGPKLAAGKIRALIDDSECQNSSAAD